MKIIDLSVTISEEIKEPLPTKIVYEDHKEGAKKMGSVLFDGLTGVFPEGNGPAGEFLTVTSHCGTHVCLLYTSDAADDLPRVVLWVRRVTQKEQQTVNR